MESLRSKKIQLSAIGLIAVFAILAMPAATAAPICAGALLTNPGDTVVMGAGAFGDCTGTAVASVLLASNSAPFTMSTGTDQWHVDLGRLSGDCVGDAGFLLSGRPEHDLDELWRRRPAGV